MLTDISAIRTYFAKLGLETEVADMYLALYAHGPQSISELSRTSRVERTRIYRLIDTLLASNLIEVEAHSKRGIIKAAPIANLRILITQREQELRSLQDELGLIEQVLARNSLSNVAVRVHLYHGAEGRKHMQAHEPIDGDGVYRLRAETHDMTKGGAQRVIPKHLLTISHTLAVYNDVVAHYTVRGGEFYGLETHNKEAADMQRQLLALLWQQAGSTSQ